MNSPLFRPEAVEHRQQKLYGEVVLATPASGWATLLLVALTLSLVLYLLLFGSYARQETVDGWLRPDKGVLRVQAQSEGVVEAIHVSEGAEVAAGAALVTLRLDADLAQGQALGERLSAELKQEREQLQLQMDAAVARSTVQAQRLRDAAANTEAELAQYRRQLSVLEQRQALTRRQIAEQAELLRQGFITKRDAERLEDSLLSHAAATEALRQDMLAKQTMLGNLRHELAASAHEREASLGALGEKLAALDQRGTELSRRSRVVLTTAVPGQVALLRVAVGDAVKPGGALLELLPEGGKLQAELFAPSRAAGALHPGTEVQLRYDAFPYQKFGVARGRVLQVSQTPVDARELPTGRTGEPAYRVLVELEAGAGQQTLVAGMTLKADLLLERRRVVEYLFAPLLGFARRR
jgi:membrane fusion protein